MKKYMLELRDKYNQVVSATLYNDLEEAQKMEHYQTMFDDYASVKLYAVEVNVIERI